MSKSALALADHGNSPALVSSDSEFGLFARALNGMAADVRCKSEALSEESSRRRNIESALIDTSVNPVITVTPNGFITTWNSGGRETVRLQRRRGDRPRYRAHYPDRSPGGASRDRRKGSRRRSRRRDRERPPGQGRTKNRRRAKRPIDRASLRQNRRALKITRDITAQKLTEEKFQLAVESCPSGMVLVDRFRRHRPGQQRDRAPVRLPPRRTAWAKNRDPRFLRIGGSSISLYRDGFAHQARTRLMGARRDLFGRHKDGTEIPVEVGLNPIQTREGPLILSADYRHQRTQACRAPER